jgi:Peptidase_C39 like family
MPQLSAIPSYRLPMTVALFALLACGGVLLAMLFSKPDAAISPSDLPLIHHLDRYEDASLVDQQLTNLQAFTSSGEQRLKLAGVVERTFPVMGEWLSNETKAKLNFTELLPSWNVIAPPDTGARFDVRVKDAATGEWSPWLYLGQWGRVPERFMTRAESARNLSYADGEVEVDILYLRNPASHYQIRARLFSFDPAAQISPELRRVTVCYSAPVADRNQRDLLSVKPDKASFPRDISVPFRPQGIEANNISSDICSPTSVSMVMEHSGVSLPTKEVAMQVYDQETDLFGNWNRAVAMAGSVGLDAYLTRISSIDEARVYVARGQPLIASIRFKKGEFPSNVMQQTAGHLIVVRGFNSEGDAIVNDPASKDKGHGIVYKANELERAWITNAGGIAYVIAPRGRLSD